MVKIEKCIIYSGFHFLNIGGQSYLSELDDQTEEFHLIENESDLNDLTIKEFFIIPHLDKSLIYIPSNSSCFLVNNAVIKILNLIKKNKSFTLNHNKLAIINYFMINGLLKIKNDLIDSISPTLSQDFLEDYKPTKVILCPTTDCNLRCVYCYASGGERKSYMDWSLAKASIDYIIKNAKLKNVNEIQIGFHGGGEPTLAFDFIKKTIDYTKKCTQKENFDLKISMGSNLIMSLEKLNYVIKNFDSITVSVDGTKEIHDLQRPTEFGVGSFDLLFDNLKILENEDFPYSIRTTITGNSINKMSEITEFFVKNFPNSKNYHFEPFFKINRAKKNDLNDVDEDVYTSNLLKAKKIAEESGKFVKSCSTDINKSGTHFCGALGEGFWVLPDGNISLCGEVLNLKDPRAKTFIIGHYDVSKNDFIIDKKKIKFMRKRDVNNMALCKDCFAKYHCRGYCPAKVMTLNGDILNTQNLPWCDSTKELVKEQLINLANKEEFKIFKEDYSIFGEPDKVTSEDIISSEEQD